MKIEIKPRFDQKHVIASFIDKNKSYELYNYYPYGVSFSEDGKHIFCYLAEGGSRIFKITSNVTKEVARERWESLINDYGFKERADEKNNN